MPEMLLIEVVLKALEDGVLGLFVAFEVVTFLELQHRLSFIAAEGLGNIDTDVDHKIALARTIALYRGKSLSTQS